MKKLLFVLPFVALMGCEKEVITNPTSATLTGVYKDDGDKSLWDKFVDWITIEIEIKFGQNTVVYGPNGPFIAECINSGLCYVKVSGNNGGNSGNSDANAQIAVIDGSIVIGFDKNSTTTQLIQENFSNGVINVSEDIVLPESICQELNLSIGTFIPAGSYFISYENDDFILVSF